MYVWEYILGERVMFRDYILGLWSVLGNRLILVFIRC